MNTNRQRKREINNKFNRTLANNFFNPIRASETLECTSIFLDISDRGRASIHAAYDRALF